MTRRGQGEYCLTPDGSSTVAGTGLLVSAGGPGGAGAQGFAIWAGYCSSSPLELEVDTYALSGAASDGVPFEAVIPSAPAGAQAPAGTVPDAGVVSVKYPTPAFSSAALVGWRSVSTAATGRYCLTPDRASTFSNTSLLLSVLQPGEAVWAGYCSTNPVELKVDTYALSGTASGTVAFMAVVNQVPPGTGSTCPACGANLIVNGNFSRPVVNGYDTISASAQGLPGWTVGSDSVDVIGRAFWPPPPGSPRASQSIDLSGGAPGRITQAVLTAPGSRYLLKWYGAGNYGCGQSPKVMHVWWDRKLVAAPTMSTTGQNSSSMAWSPESQVVTASSARSVLEFADATPDKSSCGAVVADVSLTPDHN